MEKPFDFLRLPVELRDRVYSHYFDPAPRFVPSEGGGGYYQFEFAIYKVCKTLYEEAKRVFQRENVFVVIETPWAEAHNHIVVEGAVPIVAAGEQADLFHDYAYIVRIKDRNTHLQYNFASCRLVLMLDDLHLLARVWYYSALSYPELNSYLRLAVLSNDFTNGRLVMSKSLQQKALLPFGCVKGLDEMTIRGFDESVEDELRKDINVPYDTPQECLESCTRLIAEGHIALSEERCHEALDLYMKAFHAIHVVCNGRERNVYADSFFETRITDGQYKDKIGTQVRVVLRLRLVGSVVNVYLKLKVWEEAQFWGLRSIRLIQGFWDHRSTRRASFEGSLDIGFIYLRTAIALKHLDESIWRERTPLGMISLADSAYLRHISCQYLGLEVVKKEIESNGLVWDLGSKEEMERADREYAVRTASERATAQPIFHPGH